MRADGDPNLIVYFGGQYVPMREAKVGILTHALHYGTGVFEGIRAYWSEDEQELFVLRAVEHFDRWKKNSGILHMNVPPAEELCTITAELARRNNLRTDLYIRPLAYKCAERIGVAIDDQDAFAIVAIPFGEYLHSENGLHAGVSSWRRIDDNAIPPRGKICGAYANSALASDDARRCGFDEAILLNESGHVTEGATCNLFMLRKGRLITPQVTENVLEGITRDCVAVLAQHELALEIVERPIDRSELYICDELFLTGTAVGLAPVVRVDHRAVGDGQIGAVTRRLRQLYFDAARGHLPQYRKWLLPVYGSGRVRQDAARMKEPSFA
ncbi:putative branched-chain-amino-acid aminotransferase [Candidatus Sulfotelmatomonas gaucii]|uniref:Branched-chain-amino-acid aminotransferase n=1 Tax=Candidatus Sulfuritelmatomonas gaucii TaxID=2043161 RepID=A0A2N9LFG2_9BACT|nr:putative branched-chain-amino-acid aminotransferase [Candidatus Sulfotelmatomonas gaucii]